MSIPSCGSISIVCFRLATLAVMASVTGCGGVYEASVSGVVTMDNAPLQRGTVTFHPTGDGPSAYGLIIDGGTYTLKTGREDGLSPGNYKVTVVSNEPSIEKEPGATPIPGKPITPRWYRSKDTSNLNYNVEPGFNTIDLELTSDPPAGWQGPKGRRG